MTLPATQESIGDIVEAVVLKGDLGKLTPEERVRYYSQVCQSIGVNPLTRPLEFITLSGKVTLYAKRDCADQLRKLNGISITIVSAREDGGMYVVHAKATDKIGREDEDYGVVALPQNGNGEARANAILKAITKAKRRVTLSISGLGFLDETEADDVHSATIRRPLAPAANPMLAAPSEYTDQVDHLVGGCSGHATQKAEEDTATETVHPEDGPAEDSIKEKVALCASVKALGNYFRTLSADEQEEHRDLFSARKNELESETAK